MFQITIDTKGLEKAVGALHLFEEKQLRWMVADAMTVSARASRDEMRRVTPRYIDRPTPYTLNSLQIHPGMVRERDLSVVIGFKGSFSSSRGDARQTDWDGYHYLLPMVRGGERQQKASEARLRRVGLRGKYLIPVFYSSAGAGFQQDRYGNLSAGKYIQVLSRLKAFTYEEAVGVRSGSRRSVAKRAQTDYFIARMKTSEGPKLAIYQRVGPKPTGKGGPGSKRGGRPRTANLKRGYHTAFLMFDQAPRYPATFPVSSILRETFERAYPQALQAKAQAELKRYGFI